VSDESGQPQVYVQSFPTPTQRVQVSTMGGTQPRWRDDGGELFYAGLDAKLMSVSVRAGQTFEIQAPRALFDTSLDPLALRQSYAVAPDGKRFLLQFPSGVASALTVVLNWPALLQRSR